jgi:hypothetical protein
MTGTRVYGASDDLVELEGDVDGEVSAYGTSRDDSEGVLMVFSDGTVLCTHYGKPGDLAVWSITLIRRGDLFDRIDICLDPEADIYSDQAFFNSGLTWAYAAVRAWEKVSKTKFLGR